MTDQSSRILKRRQLSESLDVQVITLKYLAVNLHCLKLNFNAVGIFLHMTVFSMQICMHKISNKASQSINSLYKQKRFLLKKLVNSGFQITLIHWHHKRPWEEIPYGQVRILLLSKTYILLWVFFVHRKQSICSDCLSI